MMKKNLTILVWIAVLWNVSPAADTRPAEQLFAQGNAAYQKQDYDSAISYYEKIERAGMHNAAVFFNMGNAYYRKNQIGMAVLYYEKARLLAPSDADILANIKYANRQTADRISGPQKGLLESALLRLHTLFSLHAQIWAIWGLLTIISVLFSAGLYVSRNTRLWFIYTGSLFAVCLAVLSISAGAKIYNAENARYAIVLQKSVDARNEPDGPTVLFTAHEGTCFRLHQDNNGWYLVSLPNGVKGWVEKTALGQI